MRRYFVKDLRLQHLDPTSYLARIPAVKYLYEAGGLDLGQPVTFFVGENGTGKSTLIEAIAVAAGFNAEGGTRHFNFSTRYSTSGLGEDLTLIRESREKDGFFLRAESFYNVATQVEEMELEPYYGRVSLHEQSHGESFLALVHNRFWGNGLYLLDEPEAALSPLRQMTLLSEMHRLAERENSQFVIATHSPILLAYPGARIYEFSDLGIAPVGYEECGHYRLMRDFLEHPERFLRYLLEDENCGPESVSETI